jgi:hypothetical protein
MRDLPKKLRIPKWILLALLLVLVFMPRCNWLFDDCYLDSDCDDDNPCTKEYCHREWSPSFSEDPSCLEAGGTSTYWCVYNDVDDGTECEIDGQSGVCESGDCRLEGESGDGGA